jgi:hypothetical protein
MMELPDDVSKQGKDLMMELPDDVSKQREQI